MCSFFRAIKEKDELEEKIISRQQELVDVTKEKEELERERKHIEVEVNPELIEKLESLLSDINELNVSIQHYCWQLEKIKFSPDSCQK